MSKIRDTLRKGVMTMSYDLHISKTEQWMDSKSNPITEKELIKVNHLLKGLPFIFE